ncbi:MAG: methionine adenosyltransferase [Candidatus Latescibacteria bacterium]|nr:methionine adenosyltransferase [Candidatus Latescibacterota bacterium]
MRYIFTSESVTEGHPDKMADQISDAILDAMLEGDPYSRVAVETFLTTGMAIVGGEVTCDCYVEVPDIVRKTIREIGYTDNSIGFAADTCAVLTAIHQQSPDIALGVDREGAGDQGLMFGYACKETDVLMPLPIILAHRLAERLAEVRKEGILDYLRPDGKTQVSVEYDDGGPVRMDTILISTQHSPDAELETIREGLMEHVVEPVIPPELMDGDTRFLVNPTGRFVIGGPQGDTGLTGRKIIVDTYGGYGSHGGGAFSGKDATKVDRSASYMARAVAKHLVAADLADQAEVQLAYAIGVADPVSVFVDTYGTGVVSDEKFAELVQEIFPLTPKGMIEKLGLRRPIFRKTAAYGHFGRELPEFTWESLFMIDEMKDTASRL